MRKIIAITMSILMLVALSACTVGDAYQNETTAQVTAFADNDKVQEDISDIAQKSEGKTLVAYFSRAGNTNFDSDIQAIASASINEENGEFIGNTEVIAKMISEKTSADIFAINTQSQYPQDYETLKEQALSEQKDNVRPELSSHIENMQDYDTVILCYPNWWDTTPMAVFTFLNEYDLSGKKLIPVTTHGGNGLGISVHDIRSIEPDTILLKGLAIHGSDVKDAELDVINWLTELNLVK